jgi:integrase/recombinase XerC
VGLTSFFKYLEFEKRVSRHTLMAYRNDLSQFGEFLHNNFETDDLLRVDYGMVRSWIIHLMESGVQPSSINRKMAALRTFYKFLLREQIIEKNPMQKVRALKTGKRLPAFVQENEMNHLLDHFSFADNFEGLRDLLVLELLYATGMRLSELIGLRDNHVNLSGCQLKVLGKRNKERIIPFPRQLVYVIESYLHERNKLFGKPEHGHLLVTNKGEACYPMFVYRIVQRYLSLYTTTPKRSPHTLRHTYATHLLNRGAEINAVKDLLGHSNLAATQVYTHNSVEKLKKLYDQAHPKA